MKIYGEEIRMEHLPHKRDEAGQTVPPHQSYYNSDSFNPHKLIQFMTSTIITGENNLDKNVFV